MNPLHSHSKEQIRSINEAAGWYARLLPASATDLDRGEWARWVAADPTHQEAWEQVQSVWQRFEKVPARIAMPVLSPAEPVVRLTRRGILRGLGFMATAGSAGWLSYRYAPWVGSRMDCKTAVGERRTFILEDGTALTLNTHSSASVRFTGASRKVYLQSGEVLIETQPDPHFRHRPFTVQTAQGQVLALGTRFTVRLQDRMTRVAVLDKAVEVSTASGLAAPVRLQAGEQVVFSAERPGQPLPNEPGAGAWRDGRLMVIDMPLLQLVEELSRYQNGQLAVDASVARIKVSGVFPVDKVPEALASLTEVFPVRVQVWGPAFTRISAR